MRICILDDVEQVALQSAAWTSLVGVDDLLAVDRHIDDTEELVRVVGPYDVLVVQRERTPLPRSLLERLPNLRLVVTTGSRNAAIDLRACADLGITVSATRSGSTPVVELAWALILAALREIPQHVAAMRRGSWTPIAGNELRGRTLGLLGLGMTGARMARIGVAFDMEVLAWSQNLTAEAADAAGARLVSKRALFELSDVVSVHLVLSPRTRGIVGEEEIRAMRSDAWLVNTSRGPICDERALVDACREARIAGIALDVFDDEPLAPDHPLRSLPNALLTPHVGYVTRANYAAWFADVVEDIAAHAAGEPMRTLTQGHGGA